MVQHQDLCLKHPQGFGKQKVYPWTEHVYAPFVCMVVYLAGAQGMTEPGRFE